MKHLNTGKEHNKLIKRLERQEKKQALQRDRFLKFKLDDIHKGLIQTLLMEEIVETDNNAAFSDLLLRGLKKLQRTSEFDFKYFTAPIRDIVPRANPISLYITQYVLEVVLNDPNIIDVYGTDVDIYKAVNKVVSNITIKFEQAEEKIMKQLANNKSLTPGSREYDIALDELVRKTMGDPHADSKPQ